MNDRQPTRISDFWLERPEQRRLRLARQHRLAQLARQLREGMRQAAPRPRNDRGDMHRPLWFLDETKERRT